MLLILLEFAYIIAVWGLVGNIFIIASTIIRLIFSVSNITISDKSKFNAVSSFDVRCKIWILMQ